MKSQDRDHGGVTRFGGLIANQPSGGGIAQPGGIPFTYTRTSAGNYTVQFDPRITFLAVSLTAVGAFLFASVFPGSGGTFGAALVDAAGVNQNAAVHFTCTVIDKRT